MFRTARRAAFSLVELLMVVAVMAIVAAMAIPEIGASQRNQLVAVVEMVSHDIDFARSLAVANNTTYRFTFDIPGNSYVLEHSGANSTFDELPETPHDQLRNDPEKLLVALDDLPAMSNSSVRLAGMQRVNNSSLTATTELEFGPLGSTTANVPTEIWLQVGSGGDTRYMPIRIDAVTGLTWSGTMQVDMPKLAAP